MPIVTNLLANLLDVDLMAAHASTRFSSSGQIAFQSVRSDCLVTFLPL
jgi:hypothetical protein